MSKFILYPLSLCFKLSVSYYVINPSFLSVLFFLLLSGSSLSVFQVL